MLENVISTMDELSYVYDENNLESVSKTVISKLFDTMSDHSSANRQFNKDLDKHRNGNSD